MEQTNNIFTFFYSYPLNQLFLLFFTVAQEVLNYVHVASTKETYQILRCLCYSDGTFIVFIFVQRPEVFFPDRSFRIALDLSPFLETNYLFIDK